MTDSYDEFTSILTESSKLSTEIEANPWLNEEDKLELQGELKDAVSIRIDTL